MLAGSAAVIVMLAFAGMAGAAEPKDDEKGGDKREPWTDPLPLPDPYGKGTRRLIDIAICDCLDEGIVGDRNLAKCAAAKVWPGIPWPPIAGDHQSLHDAWSVVEERVQKFLDALKIGEAKKWCDDARKTKPDLGGIIAKPDDEEVETPDDRPTDLAPIDLTPPDLDEWENTYPTPGTLFQVVYGDYFLGQSTSHSIVYRALRTAAFLAARAQGKTEAEANDFAKGIAGNANKRLQYLDLILCSPWNDLLYGTWGFGESAWAGPHGRSIRLMPYHADNRELLRQGKAPMRNIQLGAPADKGTGSARGAWSDLESGFEYLWLPGLDLTALWNQGKIEVDPTPWPNAAEDMGSRISPPPVIASHDVQSAASVPNMSWGCAGHEVWMGGE